MPVEPDSIDGIMERVKFIEDGDLRTELNSVSRNPEIMILLLTESPDDYGMHSLLFNVNSKSEMSLIESSYEPSREIIRNYLTELEQSANAVLPAEVHVVQQFSSQRHIPKTTYSKPDHPVIFKRSSYQKTSEKNS